VVELGYYALTTGTLLVVALTAFLGSACFIHAHGLVRAGGREERENLPLVRPPLRSRWLSYLAAAVSTFIGCLLWSLTLLVLVGLLPTRP
jgi:hypothetical protein